ncbi:MAG: thioredoxin domain-containing protein [bacterium]
MVTMKNFLVILLLLGFTIGCNSNAEDKSERSKMEQEQSEHKYTNHLINENSPYLLSHAHNPVDWYPWGEEALNKAREEDKPIFLSIGYSACHWCHVMERESFENEEIASLMNENFICIKVDREQRPDLDQIYMTFTTALTGGGGWPMSVFLTSDLKPFFAGTYFPPEDRYGRPGFKKILTEISTAYKEEKDKIFTSANSIFDQIDSSLTSPSTETSILTAQMISTGARMLMRNFDNANGGFGGAPKFPHGIELSYFLRYFNSSKDPSYLEAAEKGLLAMARGGIYDHLGGGFARYSTDAKWLVPHFEKMLYDNGLLIPVYVEAFQLTGKEEYKKVIRETLDFMMREMTDKIGGFFSALDADSEGEEGKFYVWTRGEIDRILGDDSPVFCNYYNITDSGNFEGKNILNLTPVSDSVRSEYSSGNFDEFINSCRQKLMQERSQRIRPLTDDKILTSWNGLALSAFCKGYQIIGDKKYLEAAVKNAEFVKNELYQNGKLTHAYRNGVHLEGEFLEDYAYYIRGLLDLAQTDTKNTEQWIKFASELASNSIDLFMDEKGIFYLRPAGQSDLIMRPKDETDGALPASGSMLIGSLFKLNRITGEVKFLDAAEKSLRNLAPTIEKYPGSMASALIALDYYLSDKIEIIIVGNQESRNKLISEINNRYIPNMIVAVSEDGKNDIPLFEGRASDDGNAKAYVCRNSACQLPVSIVEDLKKQLDGI